MRLGSAMMPTAASFENKHAVDQSLTSNTRKQMQGQIEGSNVGSGRIGANSVIDDGSVSESSIDKVRVVSFFATKHEGAFCP